MKPFRSMGMALGSASHGCLQSLHIMHGLLDHVKLRKMGMLSSAPQIASLHKCTLQSTKLSI